MAPKESMVAPNVKIGLDRDGVLSLGVHSASAQSPSESGQYRRRRQFCLSTPPALSNVEGDRELSMVLPRFASAGWCVFLKTTGVIRRHKKDSLVHPLASLPYCSEFKLSCQSTFSYYSFPPLLHPTSPIYTYITSPTCQNGPRLQQVGCPRAIR